MMKKVYESPSVEAFCFEVEPIMAGSVPRAKGLSVTGWGFFDGAAEGLDQIED